MINLHQCVEAWRLIPAVLSGIAFGLSVGTALMKLAHDKEKSK